MTDLELARIAFDAGQVVGKVLWHPYLASPGREVVYELAGELGNLLAAAEPDKAAIATKLDAIRAHGPGEGADG